MKSKNVYPILERNNKTQYYTKYGYVILYNNDVYLNCDAFKKGNYHDEDTMLKLKKYIDPNKNILEIGANCGTSSLVYASFLDNGSKLFAYEPQKNMFELLNLNIINNSLQEKILPINKGIFCYNGKAIMNSIDLDGGGGDVEKRYTVEQNLPCNFAGIGLGNNGEKIDVVTIDSLDLDNIGFIHCDAQGSENFIFSEAISTLKKCKPVILYENYDFYGKYLYENVCKCYPSYEKNSVFDIKKFCIEELGYSKYIDRFNGGIDTLLIP
jgi:FkbM family methyltransferase